MLRISGRSLTSRRWHQGDNQFKPSLNSSIKKWLGRMATKLKVGCHPWSQGTSCSNLHHSKTQTARLPQMDSRKQRNPRTTSIRVPLTSPLSSLSTSKGRRRRLNQPRGRREGQTRQSQSQELSVSQVIGFREIQGIRESSLATSSPSDKLRSKRIRRGMQLLFSFLQDKKGSEESQLPDQKRGTSRNEEFALPSNPILSLAQRTFSKFGLTRALTKESSQLILLKGWLEGRRRTHQRSFHRRQTQSRKSNDLEQLSAQDRCRRRSKISPDQLD